jgi:lipopolysaccharide transport system ATP-binding protein
MQPAIRIAKLSKRYKLGAARNQGYHTLREMLTGRARATWNRLRTAETNCREAGEHPDAFWALKDVSFQIEPGEVVGIIGHNGAGKSTLLKILSRITEPTTGRVELRGRIGSLLEVGSGFHPELTGRENIYLNGVILGMTRQEVARRFDDIVAFAEVEQFLDTPVKRYSSGMYVRLGFAIAAHLEPHILVVDEVLAVGDAAFQAKCLGKMEEVARGGRTILFVSHNMAAVQKLCTRGVVLERGICVFNGSVEQAIDRYLAAIQRPQDTVDLGKVENRKGTQRAKFTKIAFTDDAGRPVSAISMGSAVNITLHFICESSITRPVFGIAVNSSRGQRLFRALTDESVPQVLSASRRGGEVRCRLPRLPLVPGHYTVTLGLSLGSGEQLDYLVDAASFSVVEADVFGTGKHPSEAGGLFYTDCEWEFDYI